MLFPSRPEAEAGWRGWLTPQPRASRYLRTHASAPSIWSRFVLSHVRGGISAHGARHSRG